MYKIVRASQITLENQKYVLSTDITFKHRRINESDDDVSETFEASFETDEDDGFRIIEHAKKEAAHTLDEAQRFADEILANAKLDSESMISKAYDEAKQISEQALNDGYEQGFQQGHVDAKQETEDMIKQALDIRAETQHKRTLVFKEAEQEMIEIALDVAQKILQKRIEEDEALVYDLVKIGIEKCLYSGVLTLRVAEEDFDSALGFKNAILVLTENVEDIIIKRDKALKPGSCILDTQAGSVDSGVWTQFEQIKRSFETLLRERITEYDAEPV